jgi:hypothetical protein
MQGSDQPLDMSRSLNFQHVHDLGAGNFGVARLMRDVSSGQLVAVKVNDAVDPSRSKVPKNAPAMPKQLRLW